MFIKVDPEGYRSETALATWVRRGIDFVSRLPAKKPGAKMPRRKAAGR
jgi:hypothetical protein